MYKLIAIVATLVCCVSALPQHGNIIQILRQNSELNPDGSYQYSYETENGIAAQEQGQLKGGAEGTLEAQGSYQYTSPDGTPIATQYIANENGFQPQGAHIHPIPEHVLKALAWNAAHPEEEQETYKKPTRF